MLPQEKQDQICFLLDATGSMNIYMKIVQKSLLGFFEYLQKLNVEKYMELGFVFYRDFSEENEEYINEQKKQMPNTWQPQPKIEYYPFKEFSKKQCLKECKDSNSFYNILEEISYCCTGGDDSAEDVAILNYYYLQIAGGIKAMLKLNWNSKGRKIAILLTDSPCHGEQYHDQSVLDNFSDLNITPNADIQPQLEKLIEKNINLIIVQVNKSTTKMNEEIEKFYGSKNAFDKFQQFPLVSDLSKLLKQEQLNNQEIYNLSVNLSDKLGKTVLQFAEFK